MHLQIVLEQVFRADLTYNPTKIVCARTRVRILELIADLSQKVLSPFDVRRAFNTLGSQSVDNPHNTATLDGLGNDNLDWIGRGTVNPAYFRHHFDCIQDIYGIKAVRQKQNETMSGTYGQSILLCQFNHELVITRKPDKAFARGLAKCQAELDARDGVYQGLMNILDRFDEMRLAEDEIYRFGLVDGDNGKFCFHSVFNFALRWTFGQVPTLPCRP